VALFYVTHISNLTDLLVSDRELPFFIIDLGIFFVSSDTGSIVLHAPQGSSSSVVSTIVSSTWRYDRYKNITTSAETRITANIFGVDHILSLLFNLM